MPYQPPGLKGQLVVVDLNLSWNRLLVPAAKLSALLELLSSTIQVDTEYIAGGRELVQCKEPPFATSATILPSRYTLVPHRHGKAFKAMYEAAAQITPPADGVEAVSYDEFLLALKEKGAQP